MSKKIEFGTGEVFFFKIEQFTGNRISTSSLLIGNDVDNIDYENRVITLEYAITNTDFKLNKDVVININNTNLYCSGKIVDDTKIKIDEESDINIFKDSTHVLNISLGVSAGIFKGVSLVQSSSSVDYKGQYIMPKEVYFNDIELSVQISEMILNLSAIDFISGTYNKFTNMTTSGFVNNIYKKNKNKPKDISILILKKLNGEVDGNEEIYCHRVSSGELSIPFARDKFSTKNIKFNLMKKNTGDKEIVQYVKEFEGVSLDYLYLLWKDSEEFLWEDGEVFITELSMPVVIFEYILLEDGVELALENGNILSLE